MPVLAVSLSRRHAGLVVLDRTMNVVFFRLAYLRDAPSDAAKAALVERCVRAALRLATPSAVVIEAMRPHSRLAVPTVLRRATARAAESIGLCLTPIAVRDALARIDLASVTRARSALAARYRVLALRLGPEAAAARDQDRLRRERPLVVAFALAHAVALEHVVREA